MSTDQEKRPTIKGILALMTASALSYLAAYHSAVTFRSDGLGQIFFLSSIGFFGALLGYVVAGKAGILYGVIALFLLSIFAALNRPYFM